MIDKLNLSIWEREFELPIDYNCYEGESVTERQIELLDKFRKHPEWIDRSKSLVEDYCEYQVQADEENKKKDNIFSYIKPTCIFIKNVTKPRMAIMCNYRYDEEHGIAIVFGDDGEISIGSQDIIL